LELEDKDRRKKILHSFSRSIPVGFSHNDQRRESELNNKYKDKIQFIEDKSKIGNCIDSYNPIGDHVKAVLGQLGTLGSGNHFVEIQYDEDDNIWVMLHSGSRNIGKRVCDYFNDIAKDLNEKWYSNGAEIPFLPVDTEQGKAYLAWMDFSLRFAFLNRMVMLDSVKKDLQYEFSTIKFITKEVVQDTVGDIINIHHNFAQLENHFGKNYWVHRKGATMARYGMTGIVPGSMGTNSYIVKGLGNEKSLSSCSHGAGRNSSRTAFNREYKDRMDEIKESLKDVVHSDFGKVGMGKDKDMLDVSESPQAYKDINEVMANQNDLVEILVKLKPLLCMKG